MLCRLLTWNGNVRNKWHSVQVTFCWSHILLKWHSAQVTFCVRGILLKSHSVKVTFCSSDILLKSHSAQVTFCWSHTLLKWQDLLTLLQPVAMKFRTTRTIHTSQFLPYHSQGSYHCSVGLAAGLSTLRPGFEPRAVRVILWTEWHWERGFCRVIDVCSVGIVPLLLHTHASICPEHCVMFDSWWRPYVTHTKSN